MIEGNMAPDQGEHTLQTPRALTPEEVALAEAERREMTGENVWSLVNPYLREIPSAESEIMSRVFEEAVSWALHMIKNQRSLKDPEEHFRHWGLLPSTHLNERRVVEAIEPNEDYL